MPKLISHKIVDAILDRLADNPQGMGLDHLARDLNETLSRRTLQRRLAALLAAGRIVKSGEGRAIRYKLAFPSEKSPQDKAYIPMSSEGETIRALIRRPISARTPVGYDRAFLERYRPNETYYLPSDVRDYLHRIGHSPVGERPAGTYARHIMNRLLIDLSWASSRLEGNTYTRLDTRNLIEYGEAAEGKGAREAQMIMNHKAAIEFLVEQAEDIGFNPFTFFNLHALLSENLLADPLESGRLRMRIVDISGTTFHPLGIPQQIEQYFRLILSKADATTDPFEQAFFIMVHIPYLQPFVDVNKRVSRLGTNISLIRHNLCPLSFVDVPEKAYVEGTLGVYELRQIDLLRDVFIWAYERSCQKYLAIADTVATPDPLRLRYREELIAVISEIVRGMRCPDVKTVREVAAGRVPEKDLDGVVDMALADLATLHDGNISRYRLRLSDYRAWERMRTSI